MSAPYLGRCACGAVQVRADAEPIATRQCWCRQCQSLAAGGPTNNAIFNVAAVTVGGALAHSTWTAASGNTLSFHFCPACGTQVYGQSSARPHLLTMRFGMLDQPHGLRPQMAIWTDEAPDWAVIDPALESWPGQPPAPNAPPTA
ncbi:aldehyde-activating protein [Croceicoccus ponticola]|uniref:Aldehyde-activating protein n=1 Tax=Croceicoccus ponticola TaxID=2217664 RepID=A0A437H0K0_9SPHN|nr:GFA family protein [Croceicoccus ponticola]RVQ69096.1 aldehyde-activating protein [Croceicoccus ponticola]